MGKWFKFIRYWLPVILWAGAIFVLSGTPGLASGMPVFWDVFLRKLAHSFEYLVFSFLLFRALYFGHKFNFKKALFWSFFISIFYAFSDELHQHFVPGRQARLRDVGVDSLGAVLYSSSVIFLKIKNFLK